MGLVTLFTSLTALLFGLICGGALMFLRLKKQKRVVYLVFFTIFYIYLYKVLDYTLIQYQSLLILKHFRPDLILQGHAAGEAVNLVPLVTLSIGDLRTSLLNILLMIPFGFGLPFITDLRMKSVVVTGALFSIVIEVLQLTTGLVANVYFRVADINDVIFNTSGVAVGYLLFVGFVRLYREIFRDWMRSTNPALLFITERPQLGQRTRAMVE